MHWISSFLEPDLPNQEIYLLFGAPVFLQSKPVKSKSDYEESVCNPGMLLQNTGFTKTDLYGLHPMKQPEASNSDLKYHLPPAKIEKKNP